MQSSAGARDASCCCHCCRSHYARHCHHRPAASLAFIKSLSLPGPGSNADALAAQWLGGYGLVMPPTYPFLVGVASHPEAEEAAIQVPSCCVLTNMGLCVLPGSAPGGAGFQAVLQQVLDALCSSRQLQMFGAGGLRLEAAHAGTSCAGAHAVAPCWCARC